MRNKRKLDGITVVCAPGGRVSGVVTDKKGVPRAGLKLEFVNGTNRGAWEHAYTDRGKRFCHVGLPPGECRLKILDGKKQLFPQGDEKLTVKLGEDRRFDVRLH